MVVSFFEAVYLYTYDTWQLSDWLISYAGGFTRRGLPGEILFKLSDTYGISAYPLILGLGYLSYIFVLFFLLTKLYKKLPLYFIFSGIVCGATLYSDIYDSSLLRKDYFGLAILIFIISLIKLNNKLVTIFILINLLLIILFLSHESSVFYVFPALLIWTYFHDSFSSVLGSLNKILLITFFYLPTLIALVFIFSWGATIETSYAIVNSWNNLWLSSEPQNCCLQVFNGSIGALTSNLSNALKEVLNYIWVKFEFGLYIPLVWLLTIYLSFRYAVGLLPPSTTTASVEYGSRANLAAILIFQFMCISPLFVIAGDYGRWVVFCTLSSLILFAFDFGPILRRVDFFDYLGLKFAGCAPPPLWILFLLGVPPYIWTFADFLRSTPLFSFAFDFREGFRLIDWIAF